MHLYDTGYRGHVSGNLVGDAIDMDENKKISVPDFKGLGHSKIGYFKEVRSKIGELEKLNIQLARRHNRLDGIFNSMSDGVTILDRDLNIVYTNRVQKEMFPEISETRIKCHQVFYHTDQPCADCPVLKTFETGEMLRGEQMFNRGHLAGHYFEWTTSPISDSFGNVDEMILILRDISERKETEFKLMQTNRMLSVGFVATSLAHEINNPLTSIAGFSEGLLKRLKTKDLFKDAKTLASFKDYLEIIYSEAYRCKDIIQNLREFSSGSPDEIGPVDIDQIILDTISLIRQYAKDHHIRIVFKNHLAGGFNRINGEKSQLKHLFLNLFKELFYSLADGGELSVTARNNGEKIEICLSDPDGGLSEAFSGYKAHQSVKGRGTEGLEGMDLSICYNIIRRHLGDIISMSENKKGRLMVLRFPVVLN